MIEETTRPATVEDLETLDIRRYRVTTSGDGFPWGCLVWVPLAVTVLVGIIAIPFAGMAGTWDTIWIAAGFAAAASFFVAFWIVGGEWALLRWLEMKREARARAHPPIRVLKAKADRAWVVVDVESDDGMPYVVFDVGDGEVLCLDAATALGLIDPEDYRRAPPPVIESEIEMDIEPKADWPLDVRMSGPEVPLIDLLVADPRPQLLPTDRASTFPLRLRHGELSPAMRELVTRA